MFETVTNYGKNKKIVNKYPEFIFIKFKNKLYDFILCVLINAMESSSLFYL